MPEDKEKDKPEEEQEEEPKKGKVHGDPHVKLV